MFETYNVPAFSIMPHAVLSLLSTGRTTGLVVDSGDSLTSTSPVFEGYLISDAADIMNFGGRDLTNWMADILGQSGYNFETSAEKEIV